MVSFWKLLNTLAWEEGPEASTIGEFIRSAPRAAMMRFQKKQEPTVLHRWQSHVQGWMKLFDNNNKRIFIVKYEQLNLHFEKTVAKINAYLGADKTAFERPGKNQNVIGSGKGQVNTYKDHMTSEDIDFVRSQIGETMDRLGYV